MKIGLSASFLEKSINNGIVDGIGHYSEQVYRGLHNRGHTVVPFVFPPAIRKSEIKYSTPFHRSYTVQIIGAKFGIFSSLSPPVDVFHVTDFRSVPMNVPVVSTIWDAVRFIHPEWMRSGLRRILVPKLFKESAKYVDYVVCASEHAAKDIAKYYMVPDHKISIIPCCISEHWKTPIATDNVFATLKKFKLETEYILSVGTLQPRKNIERLIDAFLEIKKNKKTNSVKLVIVGKTSWNCKDLLNKISAHQDRIVYLKKIDSDEDLRAIYQGAKAVAFPSLYEGFGMPVLEAFASDVPLVTSNVTSIPEVAGDAAILVDPMSVKDISRALTDILLNDDVAKDLVLRGRRRLEMFREDLMFDKLSSLYSRAKER